MNKYLNFVVLATLLISCRDDVGHGRTILPECQNQCPEKDDSLFDLENVDQDKIYFLFGYSDSGEFPYSVLEKGEIEAKSSHKTGIPFNNGKFNHFYFFSSPLRNQESLIARFIIKNTQPNNTTLCRIKIRKSGNFSAMDTRFRITNTGRVVSYRYGQSPHWRTFDFQSMTTHDFGKCGNVILNSSSSEYYHHLYFFTGASQDNNLNNLLSKIIYFNSNSDKVSIFNINIQ
jgi:hypothetical protein